MPAGVLVAGESDGGFALQFEREPGIQQVVEAADEDADNGSDTVDQLTRSKTALDTGAVGGLHGSQLGRPED